jgi:uncharacterized protein (DUF1919 family)
MDWEQFLKDHHALAKKYSLQDNDKDKNKITMEQKKETEKTRNEHCSDQTASARQTIPNILHFMFMENERDRDRERGERELETDGFPFCYFLSIYTAIVCNSPEHVFLHHNTPSRLHGAWWDSLLEKVPDLSVNHITNSVANRCEVIMQALEILNTHGGVMMDIGVVSVKSLQSLREQEKFVIGKQFSLRIRKLIQSDGTCKIKGTAEIGTVCPDVMMAKREDPFLLLWKNELVRSVSSKKGSYYDKAAEDNQTEVFNDLIHVLPYKLSLKHETLCHLIEPDVCFIPAYFETDKIFSDHSSIIPMNMYCMNLWRQHNHKQITQITDWIWAKQNRHTLLAKIINKFSTLDDHPQYVISNFGFRTKKIPVPSDLHNLEQQDPSPFSDVEIPSHDFIRLLENLDHFMKFEPSPCLQSKYFFQDPKVVLLKDVEMRFLSNDCDLAECIQLWKHKARKFLMHAVDHLNEHIVLLCDDDHFTEDVSSRFQRLAFKHKKLIVSEKFSPIVNRTEVIDTGLSTHSDRENKVKLLNMLQV